MAEVWRADHQMLARPAAVKLIRPKILTEHGPLEAERLLRLFAKEARATASLRSPHTIQVYDFGITRDGSFYYVMELLEGMDLKSLVERFGPQPAERIAYLLRQACHSLGEAHDRNFVHRDVKPANIYTCHHGGDYDFVKVLDFGLVLDRHPTAEELEDEERFVGTPTVMAPEMVRFQAPVDARADIYALGCVAYWLMTGKRVFDAGTRHDLLVMHAHQKPVPPSRRVSRDQHPGLEALVMQCLEKNPNKRPQSARELAESLRALAFEHPWDEERARLWWQTHLAEKAGRRQCAAGSLIAIVNLTRRTRRLDRAEGFEDPVGVTRALRNHVAIAGPQQDDLPFHVKLGATLEDVPDDLVVALARVLELSRSLVLPEPHRDGAARGEVLLPHGSDRRVRRVDLGHRRIPMRGFHALRRATSIPASARDSTR